MEITCILDGSFEQHQGKQFVIDNIHHSATVYDLMSKISAKINYMQGVTFNVYDSSGDKLNENDGLRDCLGDGWYHTVYIRKLNASDCTLM